MRPWRVGDWVDAEPLDRRGRRSPKVLLELDERNAYLIEAARHFTGSDREIARRLRSRLLIYQQGAC